MTRSLLPDWPGTRPLLIGMLHAPALPGAPDNAWPLDEIVTLLQRDAELLAAGGADAVLLENFFDTPFYPEHVPPWTVAQLTRLALDLRRASGLPLGVNVLRNDGLAALSIAHAVGAAFIRINVLCGARVTDQGIITSHAHEILRLRQHLHAGGVRILADVNVKHSSPLGQPLTIQQEVEEVLHRGRADAVIVTGRGTGIAAEAEDAQRARAAAGEYPVLVGSGVTAENIAVFKPHVSGFIIGTGLKVDGVVGNPIDPDRVRRLRAALD